jgi:tetratricopeptide (TPR) repeat protein
MRKVALGLVWAAFLWAQADAEAEFARAMQQIGEGKFALAEQSLRGLEKAHPGVTEIRYRLGLVLLRLGNFKEASPRLEAAAHESPAVAAPWLAAARVRLKLGNRAGALEAADRAATLANNDSLWRALSVFYSEAGEFRKAAQCEVKRTGESAEVHRLLGQAYRGEKKPAEAVAEFQVAIRLAPDQWEAHADLVGLFLDHRTPEPALALLSANTAKFGKMAEFQRLLGLATYQTGKTDAALDAFLAAADLEPDSDLGYASLETLLADAGARRTEIVERLRRFRTRQPASPIGHFLLGRALALDGAPRGTVEPLFRAAIAADRGFWPAYYELAQLVETPAAVPLLAQAVKLQPDYAAAHYSLSRLYAKQGNRVLAVEHRKKHGEILERQREAVEAARLESPALAYRLEKAR